jgi:hypothetical protein
MVQLQQRRSHLLLLKSRWTSPLASDVRFDSHITNVPNVLQRLSGVTLPPSTLTWTTPAILIDPADADEHGSDPISNIPDADFLPDNEHDRDDDMILLSDIITGDEDDAVEGETDNLALDVSADILWSLPVCPTYLRWDIPSSQT